MTATPSSPSFPDSFLQQGSCGIAVEIGEAAARTLEDFAELREYLIDLVSDPSPIDARAEEVGGQRDNLRANLYDLGRLLGAVAGWWVADQPPAFAPTCVSAVDAVAEAAAYAVACLERPMPAKALSDEGDRVPVGVEVQCRYAVGAVDTFNCAVALAAVRCEVGVMARRPAPPTGSVRGRSPLYHQFCGIPAGFQSTPVAMELARARIRRELPRGWDTMSDAERLEAIDQLDPVESRPVTGRPFVPRIVHREILRCLDGRALVTSRLEDESKIEHAQMMRAVKKLREHGLVEHLHGIGYYRPDRPPPGLPGSPGGATE